MSKPLNETWSWLLGANLIVFALVSAWLGYQTYSAYPEDYTKMRDIGTASAQEISVAIAKADTVLAALQSSGMDHGSVKPIFGETISLDARFTHLKEMNEKIEGFGQRIVSAVTAGDSAAIYREAKPLLHELGWFTTLYVWRYDLYANHAAALILWIITLFGTIRLFVEME
ncbi:MAG: hypothetical protein V1668_02605 [Patescibacteria group bacterium]